MEVFGFSVDGWTLFGFFAQSLFFMRFIVQWIASEKKGESVIPVYFWYFSIAGAVMIVFYSYVRKDLVFLVAQSLALLIYGRNLALINRKKKEKSGNLAKYKSKNFVKRHFVKKFLEEVGKVVEEKGVEEVVDVGCGEGQTIKYLRSNTLGLKFIGFDLWEKAVKESRRENPGVDFIVGDIYEVDKLLGKGRVDLVMCLEVLEHLEEPGKAMEAMGRVDSVGYLFSVPNEPFFRVGNLVMLKNVTRFGNDVDHRQKWSKGEFYKFVSRYFKVRKILISSFWTIVYAEKK